MTTILETEERQMTETLDIESVAHWCAEREVSTKRGPRLLRKATPKEPFWEAWSLHKAELQTAGVSVSRDQETGAWTALWWRELPPEVLAARSANLEMSRASAADIVIPAPDGCEYMPFQKAGVAFALDKEGCLIADEMGLGKTIQALGVINACPNIHRVLIITKASLKSNWHRECVKWLVRDMSVGIADGDCFPSTDVVIINYDLLRKYPKSLAYYWDAIVMDECHQIKNRKTVRAKAVIGYRPTKKELAAGMEPTSGLHGRRRLALSGSPMENRPEELWTTLYFLDPVRWKSYYGYAMKYCGGCRDSWGFSAKGATNLDGLQRELRSTCMIRRLKKDVLKELPPKTRVLVELEADGSGAALKAEREAWDKHEECLIQMQADLELAKASDNAEAFKEAVARFRKESSVAFTELARVRHETALVKLPAVIQAIKDDLEEVQKILVFAHHLDVLTGIYREFERDAVLLTGQSSSEERDAAVSRFQTDDSCRLFVGSIRAAGEGLNLQAASLVGFAEEDWNPSKLSQCEDRAHRIGQRGNVLVKHWLLAGSLDAKMIGTIMDKQAVIDRALDEERAVLIGEPVLVPKAPNNGSRKHLEDDAMLITSEQCRAILRGLQMLSGVCDGALRLDGAGFNKVDQRVGHELAQQNWLSPRQASLGRVLLKRYRKQLPQDVFDTIG